MTALIIGLALFLGIHSVRIFADDWRSAQIARLGENRWKGLFTLASLAGFALIVWGYGLARTAPIELWSPPVWTRHLAALLTLPAFILITAAYVPGTRMKAALGHPMVAGTKIWAFAHLIANGTLADVLLFGAFLVWAVLEFRAARRRDRIQGRRYDAGAFSRDAIATVIGVVIWIVFARYLHLWLIGVQPVG
ncbi:MAG: NnrU family protein [Burkholderiaceae bacterium]|nr:NnrU family protein [Burkholderiaceae bacterium]